MADKAQQRIKALGQQLNGSGLPPINKVAAGSSTPRVQGKVIIITGMTRDSCNKRVHSEL